MKRSSIHDFTPLIDVFLILLFAVLIHAQFSQEQIITEKESDFEALLSQTIELEMTLLNTLSLLELEDFSDIEEKDKLNFIKNHVAFIDFTLQTANNQIWINGKPTPIALFPLTSESEHSMRSSIRRIIQNEVQNQIGDIYVISIGEDGHAYRYAYLMLQDALSEITQMTEKPVYFRKLTQGGIQ